MSKEITIMTAPEVPQQPVVVETGAKHMRVKWYPGQGGADRYCLELFVVERLDNLETTESTPAKRSSMRRRRSSSSSLPRAKRPSDDGWIEAYTGKNTVALVDDLLPNTVYRLRVRAMNAKGLVSNPSLPTQVTTNKSSSRLERLQAKSNASSYFDVECTGDIVVGDTILFTERVFEQASKAERHLGLKRPGTPGSSVSSLSQQSISSFDRFERQKSKNKVFITERTVAARVVNDKIYLGKPRDLIMEVLWSTLSNKHAPEQFELKLGARISRKETELFKFETFRARWTQEDSRWTLKEEQDNFLHGCE